MNGLDMTLKGKLDILEGSADSILYFIQTRSSVNFLCPSVMGRRIIEMTTLAEMDSHRHLAIDATGKNLTAPVEAAVTAAVVGRHSDGGGIAQFWPDYRANTEQQVPAGLEKAEFGRWQRWLPRGERDGLLRGL